MWKLIFLLLSIFSMFGLSANAQEQFAQYRKIEAYEVRPGILVMPRYTSDNKVCEIGIERLLYSPTMIRVNTGLSRDEINQIIEQLVPANEKGKPLNDPVSNLITGRGFVQITNMDFENVSVEIYGEVSPARKKSIVLDEVVATVRWKNRTCQ